MSYIVINKRSDFLLIICKIKINLTLIIPGSNFRKRNLEGPHFNMQCSDLYMLCIWSNGFIAILHSGIEISGKLDKIMINKNFMLFYFNVCGFNSCRLAEVHWLANSENRFILILNNDVMNKMFLNGTYVLVINVHDKIYFVKRYMFFRKKSQTVVANVCWS